MNTPCEEKLKYASIVEALTATLKLRRKPRLEASRPYKCPVCNHWHTTTSPSKHRPMGSTRKGSWTKQFNRIIAMPPYDRPAPPARHGARR